MDISSGSLLIGLPSLGLVHGVELIGLFGTSWPHSQRQLLPGHFLQSLLWRSFSLEVYIEENDAQRSFQAC